MIHETTRNNTNKKPVQDSRFATVYEVREEGEALGCHEASRALCKCGLLIDEANIHTAPAAARLYAFEPHAM